MKEKVASKLANQFGKILSSQGGNKFTDSILSLVSKQFGSELKEKYGSDDFDEILSGNSIDENDIKRYVSRLSGDNLKNAVNLYNKEYGGKTNIYSQGEKFERL